MQLDITPVFRLLRVHGAKFNAYTAGDARFVGYEGEGTTTLDTHCPVPWRYLSQTVAKFYAHRGTPACIAKQQKRRKRKPGRRRRKKL